MDTNISGIVTGLSSGWVTISGFIVTVIGFSLGAWLVGKVRKAK